MKISILGSTGSIGRQAIEVIQKMPGFFEVVSLTGGANLDVLRSQIKLVNPKNVCVKSEQDALALKKEFPRINVLHGDEGLVEIAGDKTNERILVSVSGKTGLKPTLAAIENNIDVALANKETLVMAGDIVMKRAKEKNVKILPVDSEHGAIHQCLSNRDEVEKLIITASGGPFRNKTIDDIKNATVEETLHHPRWNMGKKITIDSATLMNKGLEVIEAHHLFNMPYEKIQVVVHPQSIVHSAVEYVDGSVIAQLGFPSMHIPIQYTLTYPHRFEGIETRSFDFVKAGRLDFDAPDLEKFPCLKLAFEAGKQGGTLPVVMNAANEEAVYLFLDKKISLWQIYEITKKMMDSHTNILNPSLEQILETDMIIRDFVKKSTAY
ncbi:MAG TPA: 1-deoxy-D-xylulose-5-phosphate reductoisomerase [Candidatus Limenecus avicola]|uniref:1-deoxy-D-xylulose 5-phosphate reductoisomerase n=1 Tax=Candidatus Limenecus avicola TaxID=2840847 RepID=A0A9D1N1N3_9CLOT|nr:1-deoxy-D-xylulose-5-phosphate reductoisomerase [Candidatus Limenecus avicola]